MKKLTLEQKDGSINNWSELIIAEESFISASINSPIAAISKIASIGSWYWVLILIFSLFLLAMPPADAYVISHNRIIYSPTNKSIPTVTTIPKPIQSTYISAENIIALNRDCHASGGTAGYQAGYADACDYMLSVLGIRQGEFKTRPANTPQMLLDKTNYIKIPLKDNTFVLNGSMFRVQLFDGAKELNWLNQTGRLSLTYPFIWKITNRYVRQNTSKYYSDGVYIESD